MPDLTEPGAVKFQPALPLRGVTKFTQIPSDTFKFQPALPLRGVTHLRGLGAGLHDISTRTPLAGSDATGSGRSLTAGDFNPHSPCGE